MENLRELLGLIMSMEDMKRHFLNKGSDMDLQEVLVLAHIGNSKTNNFY